MKTFFRHSLAKNNVSESGAVMLEFAVGMLFLIPTLFTMLDVGVALNQYAKLARISYEGTRFAATVAGLEGGTVENSGPTTVYTLPSGSPGTKDDFQQQLVVRTRLNTLLQENNFAAGTANMKTFYRKRDPLIPTMVNPDIIQVDITMDYIPITPFFAPITLAVSTSGPYLYRERT